MKGIIIYENDLRRVNAVKLKNASFCYESIEDDITDTLEGRPVTCESVKCSKEDTYDFETGALIALMKMCGREKVTKACDELYRDDNYKNALQEMTENNEKLIEENNYLMYIKSCRESAIKSLENKWLYKPPTKREEMWAKIFALHKESDVIIKVKKEDVNTFLHEIENKIPEITWLSTIKIFDSKYTIGYICEALKTCDVVYFRVWKETKLSFSADPHIFPYRELKHIDYPPPMRWDLFKKGRIAVKVNYDNYKEFYEACEKELGKKPSTYPMLWDGVTISICKKDGNFEIFNMEDQKKTGRKIVDWEDVR